MSLSEQQQQYMDKRRRLMRAWRIVGPLTLVGLIGIAILLFRSKLIMNPLDVIPSARSGAIDASTLEMMATFSPLFAIAVVVLLAAIIAMIYGLFSHEKRYLEIIAGSSRAAGRDDAS